MKFKIIILGVLTAFAGYSATAQQIVESIVGIVGNEVIYLSDVEGQVLQRKAEKDPTPIETLRCLVFEDQLIQKLFLDQARLDSVEVSPENVEADLNGRLSDYVRRAGSEQALENYFNKSMAEIKKDLREMLTNQYIIQETQGTIAQTITVTPEEIRDYYKTIPEDSLPLVPRKVELSIITVEPPDIEDSKAEVRQRLLEIRSRVVNGESFRTLAVLYSEDPGSAPNGGEIGFMTRGELAKPYAEAAWSLKKDAVSKIVETEFGFHIIQMIDRKGDMVNSRHILMKPKLSASQTEWSIMRLDSIAAMVRADSLKFDRAALMFSSDKTTRANGGKMVQDNPSERGTWFTLDELTKEINLVVRNMKLGEISEPFRTTDAKGNYVYCIIRLDNEIAPHRVNMKDDYNFLAQAALMNKKNKAYQDWITDKIKRTFIRISDEFRDCTFQNPGWFN
ncbi:MAG: peptidylprolyl isomerase [Bacteroidales bacterium]|nr:peptidylprolyl isomerase [Bacteroidales bacterium]